MRAVRVCHVVAVLIVVVVLVIVLSACSTVPAGLSECERAVAADRGACVPGDDR